MSDYLDKIQTQKKDGTPLATVPFRDSAAREDITTIQNELTTDTTTIEGNPLNFTTLSAQTAKSTILSVEPIQDLHGYDKPWVGGAGKNKLPLDIATIKSLNTAGTWSGNVYTIGSFTFTINTDDDGNITEFVGNGTGAESQLKLVQGSVLNELTSKYGDLILSGCPQGGGQNTYGIRIRHSTNVYQGEYGNGLSILSTRTYDDYILLEVHNNQVANNLKFYPMVRLSTETDATFHPYTNECGISGRTEIGILGEGKNEFSGIEDGTWNTNTQSKVSEITRARSKDIISIEGNTTYALSFAGSGNKTIQVAVHLYSDLGSGKAISLSPWETSPYIFTTPSNARYTTILFKTSDGADTPSQYISNIQLEKNNQSTTFEPYTKSNDLTISLGQTVYGGTLDVENGVLVVDRAIIAEDDFSVVSYNTSGGGLHWSSVTATNRVIGDGSSISSCLEKKTGSDSWNSTTPCYDDSDTDNIRVYCKSANITDFKTEFSDLQICYKLVTPTEIQITPNTINLLKGVNNISTDGDSITLTYRDGKVATLGDLTSAVDELDGKIEDSKILTDTVTGDKYILVVTNGVLDIQQVSN